MKIDPCLPASAGARRWPTSRGPNLFLLIGSLALSAACSRNESDATPPADVADRADQLAQPVNAQLGYGFNTYGNSTAGRACIDFEISSQPLAKRTASVVYTTQQTDLDLKIKGQLGGQIATTDVTGSLGTTLSHVYVAGASSKILTIVVRVETAVRQAQHTSTPKDHNWCRRPNSSLTDYLDFVATCGDSWVQAETMGGYVLMFMDTSAMTEEQRGELEIKMGLNLHTMGKVDFDLTLQEAITANLLTDTLLVSAVGIPSPRDLGLSGDDELNPTSWTDYMDAIQDMANAAIVANDHYSPALGAVLSRATNPYAPADVRACSPEIDVPEQGTLECFTDFVKNASWILNATSSVAAAAEDAQWKVTNHPTRVWFPEPQQDVKGRYQAAVDQYNQCKNVDLPGQHKFGVASFQHALNNGHPDSICDGPCLPPVSCSAEALSALFKGLPRARTFPPNQPPTGIPHDHIPLAHQAPPMMLRAVSTDLCALTGFSGDLRGNMEWVRVWHGGGPHWYGAVDSGLNTTNSRINGAQASCVKRSNFVNGVGAVWDPEVETEHVHTVPANAADLVLGPPSSVYAINGVGGRMRSTSDSITVTTVSGLGTLNMNAGEGYLHSLASRFGMELAPGQTLPQFVQAANGVADTVVNSRDLSPGNPARARLIKVGDGFCYFVDVRGNFFRNSEFVRLYDEDDWWMAEAVGNDPLIGAQREVQATVRCYAYNQQ